MRLDLAYDGTAFSGWAIQPHRRTVCGDLTSALPTILRHNITLVVAGRTDA
ncbi:MAG: tRNA pseudouridine(38-40) synthase TruA, partial [Nonomuraea sp.]|nr:tRNA pseudouridine(38-40) synthase TruA [Nonomuraea sp.]